MQCLMGSIGGYAQVVVTVPSDDVDVDIVFEAPEAEGLPALIAEDVSDSSVTSLYDADFSGSRYTQPAQLKAVSAL